MAIFTFVENKEGTKDLKWPPEYESWIDYWSKNNNSEIPSKCANVDCYETNIVGAHVNRTRGRVKDTIPVYIIPLCGGCNHLNGEFGVITDFVLAPLPPN
jgi:hypothetical protein